MRTAIYAILVGAILLGLVFSTMPFLTYQDTRIVSVSITNDASGPLSLIPVQNTVGYGSVSPNAYVYYNSSGDLTINFHEVQTNAILNLTPAFYVDDNLNQTLNVTMRVTQVGGTTNAMLLVNGTPAPLTFSFLLSPSEGEVPVYLTLETFGTQPNQTATFDISFTAVYPA